MKLTNETVAKALGWKLTHRQTKAACGWTSPSGELSYGTSSSWPKWTTSLDAIVAEIEARKLRWTVHNSIGPYYAFVGKWGSGDMRQMNAPHATAPLALCAALLAYLKSTKGGAK